MARSKKPIDPRKEGEIRALLTQFKQQFAAAIVELETAKRNFSSAYVDAMLQQFEHFIPKHVLSMKAVDLLHSIKLPQEIQKTPSQNQPVISIMTSTGVRLNIPSVIKPRIVAGSTLQSRQPQTEELLFSVRGTPVLESKGEQHAGAQNLRKRKIIEHLTNQSEAEMSPATRRIVNQLTTVLLSKTAEG